MLQLSSTQTQKPSELNFTIVGSLHEKSHADLFIYYVLLVHFALPIIQSLSLPPNIVATLNTRSELTCPSLKTLEVNLLCFEAL